VFVITIVLQVLGLFTGASVWSVIGGSLLSVIGLILLSTRDARSYFGT